MDDDEAPLTANEPDPVSVQIMFLSVHDRQGGTPGNDG